MDANRRLFEVTWTHAATYRPPMHVYGRKARQVRGQIKAEYPDRSFRIRPMPAATA